MIKKTKTTTYSHIAIYIYGKHIVFVYGSIFVFQILIAYYTCTLKLKSRKRRNYKVKKKIKKTRYFLNVALLWPEIVMWLQ